MGRRTLISVCLLIVSSLSKSIANLDSDAPIASDGFGDQRLQHGGLQQQLPGNQPFYPPLQYPGPVQYPGSLSQYPTNIPFPGGFQPLGQLQYPGIVPQVGFAGIQPSILGSLCPLDLIYVSAPIHPICHDYYNRQSAGNSVPVQTVQLVDNAMEQPRVLPQLQQRPPPPRVLAYPTALPILEQSVLPLNLPCPPEFKLLGIRPPTPQLGFSVLSGSGSPQQQPLFQQPQFPQPLASHPQFQQPLASSFQYPQQNRYPANLVRYPSLSPVSPLVQAFPYLVIAKPQVPYIQNRVQPYPLTANALQYPYNANVLQYPYNANALQYPYNVNPLQYPYNANAQQYPQYPYNGNAQYNANALYLPSPYVPIIKPPVYNGTKNLF